MLVLGCMRLSTAGRPDRAQAEAVLRAAWAAGFRRFDTADAYAVGEHDVGHNERLVHEVLPDAVVQTKGGLVRPGGSWVPDGRAKHLRAAIARSVAILGRPIPLYLLHAVDPRTALATSLRALVRAQKAGDIEQIGLCNVNLAQLEEALQVAPITAVQLSLSAFDDSGFRGGVVEACLRDGIEVQAHSPLGGWRRKRRHHPALVRVARRHSASPERVALAWLQDLGITPIVGASRVASVEDSAQSLQLSEEDRHNLDQDLPFAAQLRTPRAQRAPPPTDGEVVLVMGMPAAGKTTSAEQLVSRGYLRLNRDTLGGSLRQVAIRLDEHLTSGVRRVVLDNTYGSRAERNRVIETAWKHRLPARCVWLTTDLAQAQRNAVRRLLSRYGALPDRAALRALANTDPQAFGPDAQHRYLQSFEPPRAEEGFVEVEHRPFVPHPHHEVDDADGATFVSLRAWPLAAATLRGASSRIVVVGWAPGDTHVGNSGDSSDTDGSGDAGYAEVLRYTCPHPAGPPVCWCRPPLPGLVLLAAHEHGIDLDRSVLIGTSPADARLAAAAGLRYRKVTSGPA